MSAIFLDTSGWFASMALDDPKHKEARARYEAITRAGLRLVTTSHVVGEMHAMLLKRRSIAYAQHYIDSTLGSGTYHVVYPDEELVSAARTRWLRRYTDQRFSLCDAVSFEVMRRERITQALATDRHFATAGYEIIR